MSENRNAPRKRKATSAPKRPSQSPNRAKNNRHHPQTNPNELWNIAGLFVSIFLLVSLFIPESGGAIGGFFAGMLRGILGIGAFFLPFLLGASYVYRMITKTFYHKTLVLSVLMVILLTFLHMIGIHNAEPTTSLGVFDVFAYNLDQHFVTNGGLLGALFGNAIHTLFGFVGAIIFVLAVSISFFVLLTNRSFGNGVADLFNFASDKTADAMERRAQQKAMAQIYEHPIELPDDKPPKRRQAKTLLFPIQPETSEMESNPVDEKPTKPAPIIEVDFTGSAPTPDQPVTTEWLLNNRKTHFILPGEEHRATPVNPTTTSAPRTPSKPPKPEPRIINNGLERRFTPEPEAAPAPNTPTLPLNPTEPTTSDNTDSELPNMTLDDLLEPTAEQAPSIKFLNEEKPEPPAMDKAEVEAFRQSKRDLAYTFPEVEMLTLPPAVNESLNKSLIYENTQKLEQTLKDFGVLAKVVEVSKGPTVTRYELTPGTGVKVSKISGLADDLALNLAAKGIRIEAPIPGKSAVGIEIPNDTAEAVYFRELIDSDTFRDFPSNLAFAMGKDIAGGVMVTDLAKMPHLLIAGATGSGKSVCINTIIVSLLYKASPDAVKIIMIDPKVVELSVYNGIPHLLIPVVTDPKKAAGALNWSVREMLKRYEMFKDSGARNLEGYNKGLVADGFEPLPQIVIIIDELADLMMAAPGDVEDSICRLAQMARAAGLHLIIATQRPSVDVITGLIKANVPSRLAFSVSSGTDSRTILDTVGAEKLLGRGDMLFSPMGQGKPQRIQGAFIADSEVETIVEFLKANYEVDYEAGMVEEMTSVKSTSVTGTSNDEFDEFFNDAVELILDKQKASTSMLQRAFRIGYQRASRLIEFLEEQGIIGPEDGSKPRKVVLTKMQWEAMQNPSEES